MVCIGETVIVAHSRTNDLMPESHGSWRNTHASMACLVAVFLQNQSLLSRQDYMYTRQRQALVTFHLMAIAAKLGLHRAPCLGRGHHGLYSLTD